MKDNQNAESKSFNRWEDVFRSVKEPIIILNSNKKIIEANQSTLALSKKKKSEIIGKECHEVFHSKNKKLENCPFQKLSKAYGNKSAEMEIEIFGGQYLISCSPLFDKNGDVEYVVHIAADITEMKKKEEILRSSVKEKETLLREIHHRVKNNFQVISSLLNLQANSITDPESLNLFNNAIYRIRSMSLIHEHLYQSNKFDFVDFKAYVTTLIQELYENYKFKSDINIDLKIDNIFLDNDDAVHCGLIINEILTNCFKYAFPSGFKGKPMINVCFENSTDNFLELKITDNGIGLPHNFDISSSKTLGMSLITGLVNQMNGTLNMENKNGTAYVIKFMKNAGYSR